MDNKLQVRLLHAAKTQDQWKAVTSYPKKGEVCLEATTATGATSFKIKIGDSTRPYCRNTGTSESPVWDFTSDQVLPYFGSVIEANGTVNVVAITTYNTTKKKLSFYTLGLSSTTVGGSTTITPTISQTPYLEMIEGDGVTFTTDETGTVKELYINLAATTEDTATTIDDGGTFTAVTVDSNNKATKRTTFTLPSISDAITDAIDNLDSTPTTISAAASADVITSVSETNGIVSSTKKTIVEGNKIDITTPIIGANAGNIVVSHEDIDTTATDVASTITTDTSSVVDEKELSVITGIKVDAQGHITHIDKDVSTNLVAADIKSPVEMIDDEIWTYRTTGGDITIDKDIANVTDVKGETLVFNQLVKIPTTDKSITNNNVTITDNRDGSYSVITTQDGASDNVVLQLTVSLVNGHKYLAKGCPKNGSSSTYKMYLLRYGNDFGEGQIFTATSTDTSVSMPRITIYSGTIITSPIVFKPQIIDLTLMFGAGNEPSTVEEFEAIYPLPYYNYNEGTLINNNASGIVTTGFNQWDEEWELGTYNTTDGSKNTATTETNLRAKNKCICLPSTIYYNSSYTLRFFFYDGNENFLESFVVALGVVFTTPSNARFFTFHTGVSMPIYNNDICINISDPAKNGTYEPYEKHTFYFDKVLQSEGSLATVTGKLNGEGESVVVFPDGLKSAGNVYDEIKGNVAIKRIGSRAYTSGDESDATVITDGTNTYYALATPETYILDQTVTGNYIVDDNGTEKLLPEGIDSTTGLPLTTPFSGIITYQSNFKDVVLDTVDKVSKYKNPVRSKEDKPQTTGKVAVYDSDSTVKSSTFEISNTAIDPEGTYNETTVPTIDAVVDYIEDVVDTEVTVQDITTTDDDISGNGGIRITNTGTTYDVHHADITQSADVTHTITPEEGDNNEAVVKLVTGVITDDFGHVKGKEVISSDKLIAADIKAPMTFTDKDTWLIRPTAGSHDVISEDVAKVVEVEGNSCVWNQLAAMDDISSTVKGVTFTRANGKIILSGTASGNGTFSVVNGGGLGGLFVLNGHKGIAWVRYISGEITGTHTIRLSIGNNFTDKTSEKKIFTVSTSGAYLVISFEEGAVFTDYTIEYQLFDLTNIFNSGNEPATVEGFESWLAKNVGLKPSYGYNEGSLLSAQTLGVKTYEQNLLNPTTKLAKLIPYEWEENSNVYTIKNVPSGATATFTPDATGVAETVDISGGSLDIISYGSGVLELSAATADTYVCMKWDGTKDNDVVPYEDHTQDFDVRKVYGKVSGAGEYVQCFPNGMRGIGAIKDTLNANEAVSKIGEVDLETLGWTKTGAGNMMASLTVIGGKTDGSALNSIYASGNANTDKSYWIAGSGYYIRDTSYTDAAAFKTAMAGVHLYYELATPITYTDLVYRDGGIDRPLADVLVNINVNNWGIEEQLLTPYVDGNPTSTAATITMQYKSNFKDAIKDLIDKVNNQKNPVMGVSNTGQTVDKIAIYDSASTVHSSSYSPSNADVVPDSAGNMYLLPTVKVLVDYVNSVLSSALTYQSTVATEAQLHSKELEASTGDLYIASATIVVNNDPESTVLPNGTYYPGTFFIWNEVNEPKWDVVPSTTTVVNNDLTINFNDASIAQEIGTVDGTPLTIKAPNLNFSDPTASSTGSLTFIDSVSQTNGLISATKKTVYSASTTQSGVVTLSSGIETTSNEDSKIPTAYDTLTNLNNRDVDSGTITNDIASLSKRMVDDDSGSQTYGDWINKPFYPTTKFAAINDFSTAFGTNYPDLNTIEGLSTTGFLKRTGDNTWVLTDDTGKMKWLDEVTKTYTYSAASTNDEELGSYIHNYSGVTTVEKATVTNDSNKYGFRIDIPILTSSSATIGKVLKGLKTTGVTLLPTWGYLSLEELDELDNLGTNTGYLRRKAGATTGTYEWELSTPDSTTVDTVYNDDTSVSDSTTNAGIKVTTNGTTTLKKVPFSAIVNDTSTGNDAVVIILNGNFS